MYIIAPTHSTRLIGRKITVWPSLISYPPAIEIFVRWPAIRSDGERIVGDRGGGGDGGDGGGGGGGRAGGADGSGGDGGDGGGGGGSGGAGGGGGGAGLLQSKSGASAQITKPILVRVLGSYAQWNVLYADVTRNVLPAAICSLGGAP